MTGALQGAQQVFGHIVPLLFRRQAGAPSKNLLGMFGIVLVTAVYQENRTYLYFDVQVTSPTAVYLSTYEGSLIPEQ